MQPLTTRLPLLIVLALFLAAIGLVYGIGSGAVTSIALTRTATTQAPSAPLSDLPHGVSPGLADTLRTSTSNRLIRRAHTGLHVRAGHILDAHGRPLRLLGVNRSGSEFKCVQLGTPTAHGWGIFDGPVDAASARAIASWHANVVRIPLNEDCWLGLNQVDPRYGGSAYRAAVKGYVSTLRREGLYVILDLHWSAPGTALATSQQPMPDSDHSPAFWRSVANTFKGDGGVVFDLYNEPFLYASYLEDPTQSFWQCWLQGCGLNQYLTGGTPYTKRFDWQAAGMQTLIDVIRSSGAGNMILVPGLDWANDVSGWRSHRPFDPAHNLAVSWHSYPGESCDQEACWSAVVAPLARQAPVVVGETGDNVCSAATYDPSFLPWADRHGLSYLGWTWNTWQDCKNILIKTFSGAPTDNYGRYFRDHLGQQNHAKTSFAG